MNTVQNVNTRGRPTRAKRQVEQGSRPKQNPRRDILSGAASNKDARIIYKKMLSCYMSVVSYYVNKVFIHSFIPEAPPRGVG